MDTYLKRQEDTKSSASQNRINTHPCDDERRRRLSGSDEIMAANDTAIRENLLAVCRVSRIILPRTVPKYKNVFQ